ncbi:hypothetical protein RND71_013900 [Anisodus tanguticus]|uniref:Uncharacterized protein n=1 Tax=Anisodus tanguticus TaxID=243964 RepID=A0AAE1SA60_9SOLA|nr:hypothetical protein RND71_013900 [Anisodus tanguticus]
MLIQSCILHFELELSSNDLCACIIAHSDLFFHKFDLVLFIVANQPPEVFQQQKLVRTAYLAKKLGGSSWKLIQATATYVSSEGLNHEFHIKGLI